MNGKTSFPVAAILLFVFANTVFSLAGELDQSFGNNGLVTTAAPGVVLGMATDLAVQSDGKVLILETNTTANGSDLGLTRYNADGSLDTGFGNGGFVPSPFPNDFDQGKAMALQTDGKIIVVGRLGLNPVLFLVVRFNPNGTLDAAFGANGIVTTSFSNGGSASAVALQADGKIVVGGNSLNNSFDDFFTIIRYNPNGSVDTGFGTSGITVADFGLIDFFEDVAIQSDGKIVAVGTGDISSSNPLLAMMRLNTNGSFDVTFDSDGRLTTAVQLFNEAHAVKIQENGKIVVGAQLGGNFALFRYNSNGSPDTSFDTDGYLTTDLGNFSGINDLAIQTDGKITAAGTVVGDGFDIALARYETDGSLDSDFGTGGTVRTSASPNDDEAKAIALQDDGKILVAGFTDAPTNRNSLIARYLGSAIIQDPARFDFDGDSKTDISIFRPGPGEWWYLRSSDGGNSAAQFGSGTDTIVPADFTGDGKTDIAFWRETTGEWFILRSEDQSFYSFPFGTSRDIPAPGDYDGDGAADPTVFRPGSATWFTIRSSDGAVTIQNFGASGDRPVVEDYDGDGRDDIAIYRPSVSEWWQIRSTEGVVALQFGAAGDKTVPADFTGDGRADIAFWRPATGFWFVLRSEDNSFYSFPFGITDDIPAPGDYDGDGTADPTVYRPGVNTWFKLQSTNGFEAIGFGSAGDFPVPGSYVAQ